MDRGHDDAPARPPLVVDLVDAHVARHAPARQRAHDERRLRLEAHQHGHLARRPDGAGQVEADDLAGDEVGLVPLVAGDVEDRRRAGRPQRARGAAHQRAGQPRDAGGRAVVVAQLQPRRGRVAVGEPVQAQRARQRPVNRLIAVADGGQPAAVADQVVDQLGLHGRDVLGLVDQDMAGWPAAGSRASGAPGAAPRPGG